MEYIIAVEISVNLNSVLKPLPPLLIMLNHIFRRLYLKMDLEIPITLICLGEVVDRR